MRQSGLFEDGCNSRRRNQKRSPRAFHCSESCRNVRSYHLISSNVIQTDCSAYDVHNRIHSADLMELHFIDRYTVGFGFCCRFDIKNPPTEHFRMLRQRRFLDHFFDFPVIAVFSAVGMDPGVFFIMKDHVYISYR